MPSPAEVAAALKWADEEQRTRWPMPLPDIDHVTTLATRVRELEGRTCETCRYCGDDSCCALTEHKTDERGWVATPCATLGNTCGAWAEREGRT
jgi:hypothetical protein